MSTANRRRKKSFTADAQTVVFRFPSAYDRIQLLVVWANGAGSSLAVEYIDEPGVTPSTATGIAVDGSPFTQLAALANIAGVKTQTLIFTAHVKAMRIKFTAGTCNDCKVYCKTFTNSDGDVDDSADYSEVGTADTSIGEDLV